MKKIVLNLVLFSLFCSASIAKVDLSGDRDPGSTPAEDHLLLPVKLLGGLLDATVVTFFWNIFQNITKETFEDQIYQQINENSYVKLYFSKAEVRQIAKDIAKESFPRVAPITRSYEAAILGTRIFSLELVKKLLEKFGSVSDRRFGGGIGSQTYAARKVRLAAEEIVSDLNTCLNHVDTGLFAATFAEVSNCTAKFELSAPYRIGRKVLEFQAELALKEKFFKNDSNAFEASKNRALLQFDACAEPRLLRPKKNNVSNASDLAMTAVRGCIYSGLLYAVDSAAKYQLTKAGSAYYTSEKQLLPFFSKSLKRYYQCLGSLDIDRLSSIEPDQFSVHVGECAKEIPIAAGKEITKKVLLTNSAIQAIRNDRQRGTIVHNGELAFDRCIEVQRGFQVEKIDPELCEPYVQTVVTGEVVGIYIKTALEQALGPVTNMEEFYKVEKITNQKLEENRSCFNTIENNVIKFVSNGRKATILESDFVACIQPGVAGVFREVARDQFQKTVSTNEALHPYLSDFKENNLANKVGDIALNCANSNTSAQSISELKDKISSSQFLCKFEIIKMTFLEILKIILNKEAQSAIPDEGKRSLAIEQFLGEIQAEILAQQNIEQINEYIKNFSSSAKIRATSFFVTFLLQEPFEKFLSNEDDPRNEEVKKKILNAVLELVKKEATPNSLYSFVSGEIVLTLLKREIEKNLSPSKTEELFVEIKDSFDRCTVAVNDQKPSEQFKSEIELCMRRVIGRATLQIARIQIQNYVELADQGSLTVITEQFETTVDRIIVDKAINLEECVAEIKQRALALKDLVVDAIRERFASGFQKSSRQAEFMYSAFEKVYALQSSVQGASQGVNSELFLTVAELFSDYARYNLNAAEQSLSQVSFSTIDEFIVSDLMNGLIRGRISKLLFEGLRDGFRKKEQDNPDLKAEPFSWGLSRSEVLDPLFDSPEGATLLFEIQKFVLNAIHSSSKIEFSLPDEFEVRIVDLLAGDLRENGFVDRVFYAFVQPELNKRLQNLSRLEWWYLTYKNVPYDAFEWENLKTTQAGKMVLEYFAKEVLRPLLLRSDQPIEPQIEKLSNMIQDIILSYP
ncbi:MAG: hypothetical protein AB7F43_07955 [Bacteriovoracia bacterium]